MESVAALKEALSRSDTLTTNMLGILSSFESRLSRLEETIMPIYQETGNLQRRHESILFTPHEQRVLMYRTAFFPNREVPKRVGWMQIDLVLDHLPDIEKTIGALDHVIEFYHVAEDVEPVIRDGYVNSL